MATNSLTDNFLTRLNQCRQEINQLFTELSTKLFDRRQALLEELDGIEKRYADSNKAEDNLKQLTAVLNEQKAGLAAIENTANLMTQQKTSLENISNLMTPETKEAQLKTIKPMTEATSIMKLAIKDMEQDCYKWRVKIEAFANISFQANTTHVTSSINQLGAISIRVAPDYTNRSKPIVLYDAVKGKGKGELNAPNGIALDGDNNIYIADWLNSMIIVFSIAGEFIREFGKGSLNRPRYICITNTNIYVSDSWSHSIVKFSIAGEFLGKIGGTFGYNDNQFNIPYGIAYYNTLIYVCDWGNNRIQVLSEELKYHKTIKHHKILQPRDIKIQQDSIYACTPTSIHIFSVGGEYISTLPHTFNSAWHIALDRYNNIIIGSNNTITIISLYKNSIIHTIHSNNTIGIAVTKYNNIVNVCSSLSHPNAKLLLF